MTNPIITILKSLFVLLFSKYLYIYTFYLVILFIFIPNTIFWIIGALMLNHLFSYFINSITSNYTKIMEIIDTLPVAILIFNEEKCIYYNNLLYTLSGVEIHTKNDLSFLDERVGKYLQDKKNFSKEIRFGDKILQIYGQVLGNYSCVAILENKPTESQYEQGLYQLLDLIDRPYEIFKNKTIYRNRSARSVNLQLYEKQQLGTEKDLFFFEYYLPDKIDDMFDDAPLGVIIINEKMKVINVNNNARKLIQLNSISIETIVIPEEYDFFIEFIQKSIDKSIDLPSCFHLVSKLEVVISIKQYKNNFAIYILYDQILNTLNVQHTHEQRLYSLGETISVVAHDFNNMIFAILGFVDLSFEECNKDSRMYMNLIYIKHHASRAANLIKHILIMSRKQSVNTGDFTSISINNSINEFLATLGNLFTRDLKIYYNSHIKDDVHVQMNIIHLEQILFNLIKNGKEAIGDKKGIITINSSLYESPDTKNVNNFFVQKGSYVKIDIHDNGKGISNGDLRKIFEPYFTTKQDGNGLGLYTIFNIVKRNRGFVNIASEENRGTTFSIFIPLSQPILKNIPLQNNVTIQNSAKLLIVDDETAILMSISHKLKSVGSYDVDTAISADDAFTLIKSNAYDVLITDMSLPGMNGIELMQKAIKLQPNLKCIIISGYPDLQDRVPDPNIETITKPFSHEALHLKIQNLLNL